MRISYLIKENRKELLIFFAGFGMDAEPFRFLKSEKYDVVIVYDYSNIDFSVLDELIKDTSYSYLDIVSWSMGVWVSSFFINENNDKIRNKIAINGTLKPINDDYGIPIDFYNKTFEGFNSDVRDRFYKKMCFNKDVYKTFIEDMPNRDIKELKNELGNLSEKINLKSNPKVIFNKVIISKKDRIIPYKNQMKFWGDISGLVITDTSHFVFYEFDFWEDIVK